MFNKEIRSRKEVYILVLISMLVLMTIFLNSFYWPYREMSKRKLLIGVIAFFGVVIVPALTVSIKRFYTFLDKKISYAIGFLKSIKIKKILLIIFVIFIGMGITYLTAYILSTFIFTNIYNKYLFYTLLALAGIGGITGLLWRDAKSRVHIIFTFFALMMGLYSIGVTPNRVGVSWDDEVHYEKVLEIANVFNGITYKADDKNIEDYGNNIYAHTGFDRTSDKKYSSLLEDLYKDKEWESHHFSNYGVWSVAYIPSAIGIILGRGLDLSYAGVFDLGRLCNLLMYIILISLAIKRIKYGKVLIAAIGLIPTTIFMASSYSYDSWVTGFTVLGFSYFFAELQDETPLTNKNIVIMLGAITIGCLPKATYFPMLFPLLFMPKRKFASARQRRRFYMAVIIAGLFLVSTFMLPLLIKGAGAGDFRGGSGVNSTEQIKFILSNPLAYARILIKFELDYVALANSASMLQRYAYVGNGYFYSIISLMLVVLAFLDRGEHEKKYYAIRGATLIGGAVAIILSTTALYISFTAVGANTVAGMQARYMVPTILPALYSLGVGGTTNKINRNAFVCVPMLIIALTFIANMFKFCVLHY